MIFLSTFYVTIADADTGNLKSLNALFDKYLDHVLVKFEQNCIKPYIILSFLTQMVNHFWQIVDAIFGDVSVTETIFWC